MSTPPRTPRWTSQSLQIKSATPTYTQLLLNKANHSYKMFLLITHPFPEIPSQHRHFEKDTWEGAHEFLKSKENVMSTIPSDYGFGDTKKWARDNIVKKLLTLGNLAYKRVFFDDAGFARLTSDKTTILHTSPFQNPLLETVIIALAFKGCLAATNPCLIPSHYP
ncbi:hypothetical protein K439DRAFT_1625066 [Ramaria rubella]|nr:hypothetical protein K439DRAFT_1625066 [Ramaria rubella]